MTSPLQAPSRAGSTAAVLVTVLRRIEQARIVDRPARGLAALSDALIRSPRADGLWRGEPIGHALHPLLTDFPLGAWLSTSLLDLFGGRRSRSAAAGLLAFGVAAAVPTWVAGVAEWRTTQGRARRVGTVHAVTSTAALGLYAASLLARLRGRHLRAVALGVTGGLVATADGYLGGHLSLVLNVGTADPALAVGPDEVTAPHDDE